MTEWSKDLEKRILKKSKFTLAFRVLRILLLVFMVYVIYMLLVHLVTDKLNISHENAFYSKLAIEWTHPNVRGDLNLHLDGDVSAFGTNRLTYNLQKRVGSEDLVIGEAHVTKRLFNGFSNIRYTHPGKETLSNFSFSLPVDPRTDRQLTGNSEPDVWKTLDMLPEGTVGELAFSTTEFMGANELVNALSEYDIQILWMPLYTGEFKEYEPMSWGGNDGMVSIHNLIGLSGGMDHDDEFRSSIQINGLNEKSVEESKRLMLKNMEELLDKRASYYGDFLGLYQLDEKYQYLQEEGFTVYGAVVTGPVKELLKLEENEIVQGEQLGEVELWNWNR